jgi:hypothetical protein
VLLSASMKFLEGSAEKSIMVPETSDRSLEISQSVFDIPLDSLVQLKDFIATLLLTPAPESQQAMIDRAGAYLTRIREWEQEILDRQNGFQLSESDQRSLDVRRTVVNSLRDYLSSMTAGMDLIRRVR